MTNYTSDWKRNVYVESDTTNLSTPSCNQQGNCILALISILKILDSPMVWAREFVLESVLISPARRILDKYRPEIPCFNDDVQGTGCVTLAAIMAGLHVSKLKLTDMRMVIFGSGTAGTGIADQVRDAIAADSGKSKEEAAKQIW